MEGLTKNYGGTCANKLRPSRTPRNCSYSSSRSIPFLESKRNVSRRRTRHELIVIAEHNFLRLNWPSCLLRLTRRDSDGFSCQVALRLDACAIPL
jgi:hypothetical protein